MMQYLELKEMVFHGYHGVLEQEKKVGNTYTVDLKIFFDLTAAFKTDYLSDTINYAEIYEVVKQQMNISSNLIEHLAFRIVHEIKKKFPLIKEIEIRLAKKNPPFGGDIKEVAIIIKG